VCPRNSAIASARARFFVSSPRISASVALQHGQARLVSRTIQRDPLPQISI
jgi:hypothetical protein